MQVLYTSKTNIDTEIGYKLQVYKDSLAKSLT